MYGVVLRKKMDADMRIILYVFADVLFVLTAVFPVVTVCCIRSYPKHRALTLLLVKELVLKSRIEDDGFPQRQITQSEETENAAEDSGSTMKEPDNKDEQ